MNNSIYTIAFVFIIWFILLASTIKIVPEKIKELKDLKENGYKIKAKVKSYRTTCDSDGDTVYSPVYEFESPEGETILLYSTIYTSRRIDVGVVKELYYNPNRPNKYYNGPMDILKNGIIMTIFSTCMIAATISMIIYG